MNKIYVLFIGQFLFLCYRIGMQHNKEIKALLRLIDDPDSEVYASISAQLLSYGPEIIPFLEFIWETTPDELAQERVEDLIHKMQFDTARTNLESWKVQKSYNIIEGALAIAGYKYRSIDKELILNSINKIKHTIWLELNNYLTPLEQTAIINKMLYGFYKFGTDENLKKNDDLYFINKTLENYKGNALSIGILYLHLCDLLDIPIRGVRLNKILVLGYFNELHTSANPQASFYIDPINGVLYKTSDIHEYLKRLKIKPKEYQLAPLSNKEVIGMLLHDLSNYYITNNFKEKAEEINKLSELLES